MSGGSARVMIVQTEQMGEIVRIAEDARDTLPGFFRHLTRASPEERHFCVKYPFEADDDSGIAMEQIWLSDIQFRNGVYYGILANTPQHLSRMRKGDKVIFEMDSITDWMYMRGGKIFGGDSIKYLLKETPDYQLSDGERELLRMFHY